MQNPSYLIKSRHDIYYFRYPLPMKQQGKQSRISVSLQTRCPKEALRLSKTLEYHSLNLIEGMNLSHMNHADVMAMFKEYYSEVLDRAKTRIDAEGMLSKERVLNIHSELSRLDELIDSDCDDIGELYGLEEEPEETTVHKQLQSIMKRFDASYDVGTKEYNMMKASNKYARRNHFKDLLSYNSQVTDYSLLETRGVNNAMPVNHNKPAYKLESVINGYLKELEPNITPRSFKDQVDCLNYLIDYFGADHSITRVGVEKVQDIKNKLQVTPTGRNKGKLTKGKPLLEQISIAEDKDLDSLSPTSVNKYLGYFSCLFDWAKRNKLIEDNLFDGIRIKNSKRANRRDMFEKDEVALILAELKANTGGLVKTKSQYWGSLIAVYTGARRNEISALTVDDVKQDKDSGIWYFNISDEEEGKDLKSEAANRLVPIHSALIDLGFLNYWKEAKEVIKTIPDTDGMSARLLYDFTYTEHDKWGRKLGHFMNNLLLKHLGLHVKNKKTLHSLRHSFITYMDVAGVEVTTIKSMVGHEQGTVTHGIYTHYGVDHLKQFKEAIEKLPY